MRQELLDFRPDPDPLEVGEMKRRATKADRVLRRLRAGPATTLELVAAGGVRFGARLKELRDGSHDGHRYDIETENHGDHAVYRLKGERR